MDELVIQEKINAAETVARALGEEFGDRIGASYIAGSITAGLGNPTSDADVFLLHTSDYRPQVDTQQFKVGDHRVDVEWYPEKHLTESLRHLLDWQIRPDNLADLWGFAGRLDFLARFSTSRTVRSSPMLKRAHATLEERWADIRRTTINYWALAVNADLEDFYGACQQNDLGTAVIAGQVLLTSAGKAVTLAAGERYFGRKWVYKQLNRSLNTDFPMDQFGFFQRGDWAKNGVTGGHDLLEFVQTCVAASQLLASENLPPTCWPTWEHGIDGLHRDTAYGVLHLGDRILLHRELQRQVTLKPEVAFVWALCQGTPADTVVKHVHALSEHVPLLRAMDEKRILNLLNALQRRELISTRRSTPFEQVSAD